MKQEEAARQALTCSFRSRRTALYASFAKKAGGCVVCGHVALRRVGTKGYCKAHLQEAKAQ